MIFAADSAYCSHEHYLTAHSCPVAFSADIAVYIAGAVRLTDFKPQCVRWLWPGRIPLGRVTLLVSDPGIGKSLLTLDIAARVSRGTPLARS